MNSLLLATITRFLTPVLVLVAIFLLLRGHNEPGGGFAGGLVMTCALALHMFAFGEAEMKAVLRVEPRTLAGIGLVVAIVSGFVPLISAQPFFTGVWFDLNTPIGSTKLGTPILFDIGVFLVVVGVCVSLMEDLHQE